MEPRLNALGQPVGPDIPGWTPPSWPPREALAGRFCRLETLSADRHAADLHRANRLDTEGRNWTYLPYGPFDSPESFSAWIQSDCLGQDPFFYAILDNNSNRAVGVAAYLRILPATGSIEVGHINYSPLLQRKPSATEAMYLMMKLAFDLGYRRYEWKCDSLNLPSRAAALRLGFSYEGVFRQATVYKGRSRDTAWYSIIHTEWPALRAAYLRWLDPVNFGPDGAQRVSLSDLTRPLLVSIG